MIMHDPVQGKDLKNILNDLLTEQVYGRVGQDDAGEMTWQWDGESAIQRSSPVADGLVTYGAFLRAKFPVSKDREEGKRNKKLRKIWRQDFTSAGFPGEPLAPEHAQLLEQMRLPAADAGNSSREDQAARVGLTDAAYCFIVPGFFHLIQHLHARGARFNLIFRTYGDDLARIAQEFNAFCEGRHPFFPLEGGPMDGSNGSIDRRVFLDQAACSAHHQFGTFLRTHKETALVLGTFQQPKEYFANDTSLAFYDAQQPHVEIHRGLHAIHDVLTNRWRTTQQTLALRDFYPFWFHECEAASAGKLLTLDPTDRSLHAVFFDDNILAHDAHIVDARDVTDGSQVAFARTKGVHLLRAEPLHVIQDKNHFIRLFDQSMAAARKSETN